MQMWVTTYLKTTLPLYHRTTRLPWACAHFGRKINFRQTEVNIFIIMYDEMQQNLHGEKMLMIDVVLIYCYITMSNGKN